MNKYLVIYLDANGEPLEPVIETANKIFDTMDMSDCHGETIARIWVIDGVNLRECTFYGTWHNLKDRLRMEIRDEYDMLLDVGYGTDH